VVSSPLIRSIVDADTAPSLQAEDLMCRTRRRARAS
jgi:hypothetical protein